MRRSGLSYAPYTSVAGLYSCVSLGRLVPLSSRLIVVALQRQTFSAVMRRNEGEYGHMSAVAFVFMPARGQMVRDPHTYDEPSATV